MPKRLVTSVGFDPKILGDVDREAERLAVSRSELVNDLLAEALLVRVAMKAHRERVTAAAYAGLGTASLTALYVGAFLLLLGL